MHRNRNLDPRHLRSGDVSSPVPTSEPSDTLCDSAQSPVSGPEYRRNILGPNQRVDSLHGGGHLFLGPGGSAVRIRTLPHRRTGPGGTLDESPTCGPGSRNAASDPGYSMPGVARVVFLDAVCRARCIWFVAAPLSPKFYSRATAQLSALGARLSARRRSNPGMGITAVSCCPSPFFARRHSLGGRSFSLPCLP